MSNTQTNQTVVGKRSKPVTAQDYIKTTVGTVEDNNSFEIVTELEYGATQQVAKLFVSAQQLQAANEAIDYLYSKVSENLELGRMGLVYALTDAVHLAHQNLLSEQEIAFSEA